METNLTNIVSIMTMSEMEALDESPSPLNCFIFLYFLHVIFLLSTSFIGDPSRIFGIFFRLVFYSACGVASGVNKILQVIMGSFLPIKEQKFYLRISESILSYTR